MAKAAINESFERAAVLRDHAKNLGWLDRRMKALRTAKRTFNGILPMPTIMKGTAWMILRRGRLLDSIPAPKTQEEAIEALKLLSQIAGEREQLPENILEMNLQLIMISWFRKHPAMKKTLIPFKRAIETCESVLQDAG